LSADCSSNKPKANSSADCLSSKPKSNLSSCFSLNEAKFKLSADNISNFPNFLSSDTEIDTDEEEIPWPNIKPISIKYLPVDTVFESPNKTLFNHDMEILLRSSTPLSIKTTKSNEQSQVSDISVDELNLYPPSDDSGLLLECSLNVVASDEEDKDQIVEQKDTKCRETYKKPSRPCYFCGKQQSRLKRHILTKHSAHEKVAPLLKMTSKEQDRVIDSFRKKGIRNHNMDILKLGKTNFIRERLSNKEDLPVMCTGCKGFFARSYKSRHQLVCTANSSNLMLPLVSIEDCTAIEKQSDDFKKLLGSLQMDEVSKYLITDEIILMIGARSFASSKRKKDKVVETNKNVRGKMRLLSRLYLTFREVYSNQTDVRILNPLNNASDMFRREVITLLGTTINKLCETDNIQEGCDASITSQKSGLKVNILNLLKLSAKFLTGHFLVKNEEIRSTNVTNFIQVQTTGKMSARKNRPTCHKRTI